MRLPVVRWLRPGFRVVLDWRIQQNGDWYLQIGALVIRKRY
jgi:hypothetical protein